MYTLDLKCAKQTAINVFEYLGMAPVLYKELRERLGL